MVVILLNMLLAILMDAYAIAKHKAGMAQTLMRQVSELMRRRRQTQDKQRVRLNDIYDVFFEEYGNEKDMLSDNRKVKPQELLDKVEMLKMTQAKRTLKNALEFQMKAVAEEQGEVTLEDAKGLIEKIDGRVKVIHQCTSATSDAIKRMEELPRVHLPDPDKRKLNIVRSPAFQEEVNTSVQRLSEEMASVLASKLAEMDQRQRRLEEQQACMHGILSEAKASFFAVGRGIEEVTTKVKQTLQEIDAADGMVPTMPAVTSHRA